MSATISALPRSEFTRYGDLGRTRRRHLVCLVRTAHEMSLAGNHRASDEGVATARRLYGGWATCLAFALDVYDVNNA